MTTIKTYKNTKKLQPELRFSDFIDKWTLTSIGKNCVIKGRIGYRGYTKEDLVKAGEGALVLGGKHIQNQYLDITDPTFLKWGKYYESPEIMVEVGHIIFSQRGTLGDCALIEHEIGKATINPSMVLLKDISCNKKFLYYILTGNSIQREVDRISTSTAVPMLSQKQINEFQFHIPSLPEQQKIASFLSAVDEKIQQLTRKKELLEQYKKGVMQQLFSGKLRFKDPNGKPYPKWQEKLFEEIYSFYSTNSLSRDKLNYETGSVKNIHYGDIHTKFSSQFIVNEEYVPYINSDVDLSKVKDENYCREGDLVIADASEDYNDIGKSIELVNLNNEKVVAGLHTFLARPDLSKIRIGFSGYLVQAEYVRMQVKKIAQGTKVLSLSPGRLGKVKLSIPSKEEQQKIASFLTALDAKIENMATQITHTQTFKKGLLQQMFV